MERMIKAGDIVRHFKREYVTQDSAEYLYKILAVGSHTENAERLVVYQGLYPPYKVCCRPYDMFISEVDREKYPDIRQIYRFEKLDETVSEPNWRLEKELMALSFHYRNAECKPGQTLFVGSSLMEMFPIDQWASELPGSPIIYNRGVGGFTTEDMLTHLDSMVYELAPSRIFINIGTNDLTDASLTIEEIIAKYRNILLQIREHLPDAEITMMAYYPINFDAATPELKGALAIRTNEKLREANAQTEQLAKELGLRFINVNAPITDELGRLRAEYTLEGMHINEAGYRAILGELSQYL